MTTRIDARGQRCPWPAIRLARVLRETAGPVEMLADDPAAPRELAQVAEHAGVSFEHGQDGEGQPLFRCRI